MSSKIVLSLTLELFNFRMDSCDHFVQNDRFKLVLFSCPVMSNSSWPHGLQHTRPPCPSPSPRVCPSSCPLHRWCHPVISSSDTLLSFCLQSFPASGSFPMSRVFESSEQNIGASASASVLPMSLQGLFQDWLVWCLLSIFFNFHSMIKIRNSVCYTFCYGIILDSKWDSRTYPN